MVVRKVLLAPTGSARLIAKEFVGPCIPLTEWEIRLAQENASRCTMGGQSQVRDTGFRRETCREDNITGQLCELAFSKYWFGNLHHYQASRWTRDQNPNVGDGGFDIPGMSINIKGSLRRKPGLPFSSFNLLVRPKERHVWATYIQAVVSRREGGTGEDYVALLGWFADRELPESVETEGPFAGAFKVPFKRLHSLPEYPWRW